MDDDRFLFEGFGSSWRTFATHKPFLIGTLRSASRNWSLNRSVIFVSFESERSVSKNPGPLSAEIFNVVNHENFGNLNNTVFSASGNYNASAGTITPSISGTTPRHIQFGLKLTF